LTCLVILAGVGAFALVVQKRNTNSRLEAEIATLDRADPRWRLEDIEADRIKVPDEANSAVCVMAARKLIPKGWPSQAFDEKFQDLEPVEQLSAEQVADLNAAMADVKSALEVTRKLTDLPVGRHRLEYSRNVITTLLQDQQETRTVSRLLYFEAMRQTQAKDLKGASRTCLAALNAARSLGDEPFVISQLIRHACVLQSAQAIVRVLSQGEARSEDLLPLQRLLEDEDRFNDLLVGQRGERGSMHQMFQVLESGELPMKDLMDSMHTRGESSWMTWINRPNPGAEHPIMLNMMTRCVEAARLPMHEQAEIEKALEDEIRIESSRLPLIRMLIPALKSVGEASRRKHAQLRSLIAALAVERYRLQQGTWPESLEKLTPAYLSAVPLDPYDGKPLRYLRLLEGVVLYAIGPDGADNGGILPGRDRPPAPGTDIGYRLWDPAHRRQPPRPVPPPLKADEPPGGDPGGPGPGDPKN
jgi:hypothetical protein